ncbi:SDR family NAD(P)-dependent oxidoreductase [Clostridium sp. 'White wine YQ']|uniref:SDR family NAD(P)-dependent oxidoreductase n=1 Tax=Clostridium sp. 'White wine YQ' TaxID=3027474 RepID=UPI0023659F0A|nr:SDR family oxidoreductase [Clostridium sp. 'White wine YQ']MDD7795159.1 SDR family oxidoreductase [Clostridium sp. 'White wine YQ']
MDKYTIITGASSGIGYELSKLFAKGGNNLILVARNYEALYKVKEEISKLSDVDIEVLSIDLSNEDSVECILDFVKKKNIFVDNLVNNAGLGDFGEFSKSDYKRQLDMIQVNIMALTKLTKVFIEDMVQRGTGSILNVASTAAFAPGSNMSVYYATKAFVLSFTEALYEENTKKGIRVMALCPGAVNTGFQQKAGIKKSKLAKGNIMAQEEVAIIGYTKFIKTNKAIVIPGFKNKLLIQTMRILPRSLIRKIIKRVNKG